MKACPIMNCKSLQCLPNRVAAVAGRAGFHGNKEPILWCVCDYKFNEIPLDIVTFHEVSLGTGLQNTNGKHTTWQAITALVGKKKNKAWLRFFYLRI